MSKPPKITVKWEPDCFRDYSFDVDPDEYVGDTRDQIAVYLEDELDRQLAQRVEAHCADFDRYVDEIFAAAEKIRQEEEAGA